MKPRVKKKTKGNCTPSSPISKKEFTYAGITRGRVFRLRYLNFSKNRLIKNKI